MNRDFVKHSEHLILFVTNAWILYHACIEFYQIAWGTGIWWEKYSLTWSMAFFAFLIFCLLYTNLIAIILFRPAIFQHISKNILKIRESFGFLRWIFAIALFVFPVWFLQATPWGVVFHGLYFRLTLWSTVVFLISILISNNQNFLGWREFIVVVILTSTLFTTAQTFLGVTDYPFSLGWSEGNRLWDYSVIFGRDVYYYPAEQEIPVYLDVSRQLVGGLPFLFPNLTIKAERAWVSLSFLLPYILLGLAAFLSERKNIRTWILTSLWVLLFLKQGPIHIPLVLCAVLVALTWRRPLWLAVPAIIVISCFANFSRFTWMFAPGMWLGMLELVGQDLKVLNASNQTWRRAIILSLAGALGGYFGVSILNFFGWITSNSVVITIGNLASRVSEQPLLWYRLFPNSTYGSGILIGLLNAVLPLIFVLFYLVVRGEWKLNLWQSLCVFCFLGGFLFVGLIISTKIGGGGDLHNMDMFLIGLVFVAIIAWQNGGKQWIINLIELPIGFRIIFALLFILPGIQPLRSLRTYEYYGDTKWLETLTDSSKKNLDFLPAPEVVEHSLKIIREQVSLAQLDGDVLFMDQRQLLTFEFVTDVPLIPEYEKKLLMDQALSGNSSYFSVFYEDLATKRFSLIISEPLKTPIKDSSYQFGEENNAWVTWVSIPVLCYYEPTETIKEVNVQLLVPKPGEVDCSEMLP